MRLALSLISLFILIISFQNCSSSQNDPGFFVTAEPSIYGEQQCDPSDPDCTSSFNTGDCYSAGLCEYPEEALWIKIKESNPYTINLLYQPAGLFTVGGTCGTSIFFAHTVHWEVNFSGSQVEVGRGQAANVCINGRFSLPINATLEQDQRYEVTIELMGIDENGAEVANPLPNNISRVDIVVISEEIQNLVDPNDPNNNGQATPVTQ